jgi:hypothetical protein
MFGSSISLGHHEGAHQKLPKPAGGVSAYEVAPKLTVMVSDAGASTNMDAFQAAERTGTREQRSIC